MSDLFSNFPNESSTSSNLASFISNRPTDDKTIAAWIELLALFRQCLSEHYADKGLIFVIAKALTESQLLRSDMYIAKVVFPKKPAVMMNMYEIAFDIESISTATGRCYVKSRAAEIALHQLFAFVKCLDQMLLDFKQARQRVQNAEAILDQLRARHPSLLKKIFGQELSAEAKKYWCFYEIYQMALFSQVCQNPDMARQGAASQVVDYLMKLSQMKPVNSMPDAETTLIATDTDLHFGNPSTSFSSVQTERAILAGTSCEIQQAGCNQTTAEQQQPITEFAQLAITPIDDTDGRSEINGPDDDDTLPRENRKRPLLRRLGEAAARVMQNLKVSTRPASKRLH